MWAITVTCANQQQSHNISRMQSECNNALEENFEVKVQVMGK
jgi:hypothetical protein